MVHDGLRTQLWPLPSLSIALAVVMGVGLPRLDGRIDDDLPDSVEAYLFGGGAEASRAVLEAIAGSLVTVTSLTFSLTVVTLQLASSQFSPRLLRTFTRDRFVHVTLSLFLATFTYALTVLRTVRSADADRDEFVPQLSVTVALLLVLSSVVGLVLFLAHLARQIRVETMLRDVHTEARHTLRRVLAVPGSGESAVYPLPVPPADADVLLAGTSGFYVRADEVALLAAAAEADAVLVVDRQPGSHLVAGTPLGAGWPRTAPPFDPETRTQLIQQVAKAITTGVERTAAHDVGFGLRQLTDVATKALSPGVNDPTTAVHALGHSAALLCELAVRDLGPRLLRDEHDRIRVVLSQPDLGALLDLAVSQPRRYGAGDPEVLARLYALLDELGWCAGPDRHGAIAEQLARLRATTATQDFDATERSMLAALAARVDRTLQGRRAATAGPSACGHGPPHGCGEA